MPPSRLVYRSDNFNPDLDAGHKFPFAVPDLAKGPHTAIPRTDADLSPNAHIQAIANTAAFHFGTIEQGGTTLYPALAQRATSVEVLRILISIGPPRQCTSKPGRTRRGLRFRLPSM